VLQFAFYVLSALLFVLAHGPPGAVSERRPRVLKESCKESRRQRDGGRLRHRNQIRKEGLKVRQSLTGKFVRQIHEITPCLLRDRLGHASQGECGASQKQSSVKHEFHPPMRNVVTCPLLKQCPCQRNES